MNRLTQMIPVSTKENLRLMTEIFTVNIAITRNYRYFNNNKDERAS